MCSHHRTSIPFFAAYELSRHPPHFFSGFTYKIKVQKKGGQVVLKECVEILGAAIEATPLSGVIVLSALPLNARAGHPV